MKLRNGFVSNSSSSSFCIYGLGICVQYDELDWLGLKLDREEEGGYEPDIFEQLFAAASFAGVDVTADYEAGRAYIGIDPSTIGDDETGAQFKKRAFEAIKKLFPEIEKSNRHPLEYMSGIVQS